MKKFKFSLDAVLSYKEQILDALQSEHAEILGNIRQQEDRLKDLKEAYQAYGQEYQERCAAGLSITEVLAYQASLRARETELQQEALRLRQLQQQEAAKREEVLAARTETASMEKLQEKQLQAYRVEEAKREEQRIEEFVVTSRTVRSEENAS